MADDLYDDPQEWAKLAAKLGDERSIERSMDLSMDEEAPADWADAPTEKNLGEGTDDDWLEAWDDEEPTGVIGGLDTERPEGESVGETINPMPGTAVAHLMDEVADMAHAIEGTKLQYGIGRSRGNDLQIAVDGEISRKHARITRNGDSFYVEDLGSTNGTLVNGRLVESARLFGGEEIQVGLTRLRFVLLAG